MQGRSVLLRFLAVPLRHKLIAAAIVLATAGGGIFLGLRKSGQDEGTALLLFNASAANRIALGRSVSGLSQPGQQAPAVALARSILSDGVVAALAGRIDPGSGSGPDSGAGQDNEKSVEHFRSLLELTQPTPKTLRVHYNNNDPKLAAAAANAVGEMLGGWIPVDAPAQPGIQAPSSTPIVKAPKTAASLQIPQSFSAALRGPARSGVQTTPQTTAQTAAQLVIQLQAQLASTDRRLARLAAGKNHSGQGVLQPAPLPTLHIVEDGPDEVDRVHSDRERLVQQLAAAKKRATAEATTGAATDQDKPQIPAAVMPPVTPLYQEAVSPFTLTRRAGEGGFDFGRQISIWLGTALGPICGLLYATLIVRRYRPVEDAEALKHALPAGVAYLGAVSRGAVSRGAAPRMDA